MKTMSLRRSALLALSLAALAQTACTATDTMESAADDQDEQVGSASEALTLADIANKEIYISSFKNCFQNMPSGAFNACAMNLSWSGTGTGTLWSETDEPGWTPWVAIPVPGTTDQFYLQNKWHCPRDGRCNMNLSWSGNTVQLEDESDFANWVPWQIARVGTSSTYRIYTRWGCDQSPAAGQCGYYLGNDGATLKIYPVGNVNDVNLWQMTVLQSPDNHEVELAKKFAPRLRFDDTNDGSLPVKNYPMSAQSYYDQVIAGGQSGIVENTNYATVANYANQVPTYYQVRKCGNQIRILYWWFYGYQHSCSHTVDQVAIQAGKEPSYHNGDWERVMVTVSSDQTQVAAVTYWAHSGRYTRIAGRDGIELTHGTAPVIYPGRTSHASYHDEGGIGGCGYWDDMHENSGSMMDTWNNLVDLDDSPERWILEERAGSFDEWGSNGVGTHPTEEPPTCYMAAADYDLVMETAYLGSQCKDGDYDLGLTCATPCPSGWFGSPEITGTCAESSNPFNVMTTTYNYSYPIPTTDKCLMSDCH